MNTGNKFPTRPLLESLLIVGIVIGGLLGAFCFLQTSRHGQGTLIANQAWAEGPGASGPRGSGQTADKLADEDSITSVTRGIFREDPLQNLSESLKARQHKLDAQEKALAEERRQLEALRIEVDQKLKQIEKVRKEMEEISDKATQQRKKDLTTWVTIYQSMQPQKAGQVIQGLDTKLAIDLLAQMEPKKAAKILSFMTPEKGIELGKKLEKRP